jgi:hypothetical protein
VASLLNFPPTFYDLLAEAKQYKNLVKGKLSAYLMLTVGCAANRAWQRNDTNDNE